MEKPVQEVCHTPPTLRALAALFLIAVSSASAMRRKYRSRSFCNSVRLSGDVPGWLWKAWVQMKRVSWRVWGRTHNAIVSTTKRTREKEREKERHRKCCKAYIVHGLRFSSFFLKPLRRSRFRWCLAGWFYYYLDCTNLTKITCTRLHKHVAIKCDCCIRWTSLPTPFSQKDTRLVHSRFMGVSSNRVLYVNRKCIVPAAM